MDFFLTYIVPVLLVAGIAAVFGFLLSYLGVKLSVKRDPKIDEVLANLAGANCGGCGFPGCDGFAAALVEGRAELSACNPTSKGQKDVIANILGVTNTGEDTVAVVNCVGGSKCRDKFEYAGYETCPSADTMNGGSKACATGCMGFGTCVAACKYNAVAVDKDAGYAAVNDKLCTSCGDCIRACPKNIITRIPKSAPVYCACRNTGRLKEVSEACKAGCIGCGVCQKACKFEAITMENNLPVFDYKKCTACMACVQKCPTKVIIAR
jgi:electron transport complex protein RnfB